MFESFVTARRDKTAALKFLRKALQHRGTPDVIITDQLASYGAALKELGATDKHESGRWLNHRAENSNQPFRRRERAMLWLWRVRSLQKFVAWHGSIHNDFNQNRHISSRPTFKDHRADAVAEWRQLCTA